MKWFIIFVCVTIFQESSGECIESHAVICNTVEEFEQQEQLSWTNVMIKSLPNETVIDLLELQNFRRVERLTIVGKTIKKIGDQWYCIYKPHLKYLTFFDNDMKTLSKTWPGHNPVQLEEFTITRSLLQSIESGAFTNVEIKKIDLSHNLLPVLESDTFNTNLNSGTREIYLNHNKLTHIEPSFPPNLVILNINDNQLTFLQNEVLSSLRILKGLYLNRNSLLNIPSLKELKALEELELSHNRIKSISKSAFKNMKKLRVLDLSHNRLKEISALESILLKNVEPHVATLTVSLAFNHLENLILNIPSNTSLEANTLILFGNLWNCNRWSSIERVLKSTKVIRDKCDVKHFNSGKVPYCISGLPAAVVGSADSYYKGVREAFLQEITNRTDIADCLLKINKNFERTRNMLRTSPMNCMA